MLKKPIYPEILTFKLHEGKNCTYITVDCYESTKLYSIIPDSLRTCLSSITTNRQQTKSLFKFGCKPVDYFKKLYE